MYSLTISTASANTSHRLEKVPIADRNIHCENVIALI
jgi:hypothetical protein